jgi:hypothetical protein
MKLFYRMKAKFNAFKMQLKIKRDVKRYQKVLAHSLAYLRMKSNRTCTKCMGRGQIGFNRNSGTYVPCPCTQRSAEDRLKAGLKKLREIGWAPTKDKVKALPNLRKRKIARRRSKPANYHPVLRRAATHGN